MEPINTLHEYMLHTKGIIYILIVVILVAMSAFWKFLSGEDED